MLKASVGLLTAPTDLVPRGHFTWVPGAESTGLVVNGARDHQASPPTLSTPCPQCARLSKTTSCASRRGRAEYAPPHPTTSQFVSGSRHHVITAAVARCVLLRIPQLRRPSSPV